MDDRRYEWDPEKSKANKRKHGFAFDEVRDFVWDQAIERLDIADDGEIRWRAVGPLRGRFIVMLVYTERKGRHRIISLRRAKRKEIEEYVEEAKRQN